MHQKANPASAATLGGAGNNASAVSDVVTNGNLPAQPVQAGPEAPETALAAAYAKAQSRARCTAFLARQQRIDARQKRAAARASIGVVYVDQHVDDKAAIFFSVNYFDGEGGEQLGPFKTYREAKIAARKLAKKLGAESKA